MIHEKTFLGLIPETPRPKDYISGVNSPIVWTDVMPSGEWTRYASKYERQNKPFETFNCTAFSLTNVVEMWLNFLIETNQLPQAHLDFLVNEGYVDDGGGINLSERAIGSWAGTNENGNRLTTVADTALAKGFASNKLWPFGGANLKEYYTKPPKEVEAQAARFKQMFQFNYEWFYNSPGTYMDAMKQCPLWVALCTCGGWSNPNPPPVPWCNAGDATNHAVSLTRYNGNDPAVIVDHYEPFVKELALNYTIPYALKVIIKPKSMNQAKVVKSKVDGSVYVAYEMPDEDYLKKKASLEGFEIPNPIPDTDSLK